MTLSYYLKTSLELLFAMGLFTPAKRLTASLMCVIMGFEYRIHVNVGWSPIVPLLYGAMVLIVVVMGQGPKKKVWLSSVAQSSSPENKKND